jgi:hypothetical protein
MAADERPAGQNAKPSVDKLNCFHYACRIENNTLDYGKYPSIKIHV